jgi:glucose/arabinose dehydrogenase
MTTHAFATHLHRTILVLAVLPVACRDADPSVQGQDASSTQPTSSESGIDGSGDEVESSDSQEPGSSSSSSSTADEGTTEEPMDPDRRLEFVPIATDEPLVRATDLQFLPGTSELLVLSKDGDIGHYVLDEDGAHMLGRFVVPNVHTPSDCGLISAAIDPDFADNRLFYVGVCLSREDSAIYRLELIDDYEAVVDTRAEIMTVGHPGANQPWHNIGSMGFDSEGNLWALFGDKTVPQSSQDLADNLGAIVRVVPDRSADGSGYEPVLGNPYYGHAQWSWDIWAVGLRSPWKGLLDDKGRYWVGDVGSKQFEEVNLVSQAGQNLAWPVHEGLCTDEDCGVFVDPVAVWPHAPHPYIEDDARATASTSRVAWVGIAYEDRGNDPYDGLLTDKVLFGDSCVGFVRALEADDEGNIVSDEHLGHIVSPTGWGQGPDGHVYVVTYGGCGSGSIDNDDPPDAVIHRVELASR